MQISNDMIHNMLKIQMRILSTFSILLFAMLSSCTAIPTITKPPSLPDELKECAIHSNTFQTNEDLIYGLYQIKNDLDVCKSKHDTIVKYYEVIQNES